MRWARSFASETIAHYGAITELILDHGWPPDAVTSEPHGPDAVTKGSVDAILKRGNDVVVSVEAKGPPRLLQHLVDGMNRCTGEVGPGHTKSDHNKCLGLLLFRSPYFLGVACGGTRDLYRVEFAETRSDCPANWIAPPSTHERRQRRAGRRVAQAFGLQRQATCRPQRTTVGSQADTTRL